MYVIGLTGAIAVGKSTVATLLAARGAATIDGDQVVHTLYAYNRALVTRIVARFGPAMLTPDGSLDRTALGRTVFPGPGGTRGPGDGWSIPTCSPSSGGCWRGHGAGGAPLPCSMP